MCFIWLCLRHMQVPGHMQRPETLWRRCQILNPLSHQGTPEWFKFPSWFLVSKPNNYLEVGSVGVAFLRSAIVCAAPEPHPAGSELAEQPPPDSLCLFCSPALGTSLAWRVFLAARQPSSPE